MDWSQSVNNYCERVDATYWSEPRQRADEPQFSRRRVPLLAHAPGQGRPRRAAAGRRSRRDRNRLVSVPHPCPGLGRRRGRSADPGVHPDLYLSGNHTLFRAFRSGRVCWPPPPTSPFSTALSRLIEAVVGPLNGSVSYLPVAVLIAGYAAPAAPPSPRHRARPGPRRRACSASRFSSARSTRRSAPPFRSARISSGIFLTASCSAG